MELTNVCIYTKQPHNSKSIKCVETIFPQVLGGKRQLQEFFVSQKVATHFSDLENHFSLHSFKSAPRFFEGPVNQKKTRGYNIPKSNVEAIDDEYHISLCYRMIAKIAFNLLAFEKGQKYVLDSQFDEIRNWIYTGEGDNRFVNMLKSDDILKKSFGTPYPVKAHATFFHMLGNYLIAYVTFYGASFGYSVKLAELNNRSHYIQGDFGLICDWNNRKEYNLSEYDLLENKLPNKSKLIIAFKMSQLCGELNHPLRKIEPLSA